MGITRFISLTPQSKIIYQSLRHFVPPPLWLRHTPQCYGARQGRSLKMFEMHFTLSPCVAVREYRGSVRRTRGLTITVKNLTPSFSRPLLRNYRFFGLFPIFFYTTPRNATGHGEGEGQTRSVSFDK